MVNISEMILGKPFSIKLDNGLYIFTSEGGTGESYVADILNELMLNNVRVIRYDTNKSIIPKSLQDACGDESIDLVYLDRAGMYIDESLLSLMLNVADHKTFIMDLKARPNYIKGKYHIASLYFGEKGIEVF